MQHLLKRVFLICLASSIIAIVYITIHHDKFPHLSAFFNSPLTTPQNPISELEQPFMYTPFQSANILGNISDFEFLTDCNVCDSERHVHALFIIASHPAHRLLRDVFREFLTTPNSHYPNAVFKTIFTFGHLQDQSEQLLLEEESEQHGDIVQGNFVDSYHNVTLRDLMGLRWAWQKCPQTRYVVRMDDDVAFDVRTLLRVLDKCCSHLITFVGCYRVHFNNPVLREGHYGISPAEFNGSVYETHCAGWLYVVTPTTAYRLDRAVERVKMFWINDAYVTGSLVKRLGLGHAPLDLEPAKNTEQLKEILASGKQTYSFGPTGADLAFSRQLFQFYADQSKNKKWEWEK